MLIQYVVLYHKIQYNTILYYIVLILKLVFRGLQGMELGIRHLIAEAKTQTTFLAIRV